MPRTSDVAFSVRDLSSRWFFALEIRFDDACEEVSGSRMAGRLPEEQLMRAALMLMTGAPSADVWLDWDPGLAKLTLTAIRFDGLELAPTTIDNIDGRGCEISWTRCDERDGSPLENPVALGVARSIVQLARAALDLGEATYRAGRPPIALLALRATLAAMKEEANG